MFIWEPNGDKHGYFCHSAGIRGTIYKVRGINTVSGPRPWTSLDQKGIVEANDVILQASVIKRDGRDPLGICSNDSEMLLLDRELRGGTHGNARV